MAALPVAACGGPLLYGLVKPSTRHHYKFMAVTLDGYIFRLEPQGTVANPKTGLRCRSPKCLAWMGATGICKHKGACDGGTEANKLLARKMVVTWALFMAWRTHQAFCGMIHLVQFAALCGLEVDQDDYDLMDDIRAWAGRTEPETVEKVEEVVKDGAPFIQDFNRRFPGGPGVPPVPEPRPEVPVPRGAVAKDFVERLAKIRKRSKATLGRMDKSIMRKRSRIELLQSEIDQAQRDRDEQQQRFDAQVITLMAERERLDGPDNNPEGSGDEHADPSGSDNHPDHSDESRSGSSGSGSSSSDSEELDQEPAVRSPEDSS
jgi:hypothetical protein